MQTPKMGVGETPYRTPTVNCQAKKPFRKTKPPQEGATWRRVLLRILDSMRYALEEYNFRKYCNLVSDFMVVIFQIRPKFSLI